MTGLGALPTVREQFFDFAGWLRRQTLENVFEVAIRIVSVEFCGLDKAHDGSGTLPSTQGPCKEPVGVENRQVGLF